MAFSTMGTAGGALGGAMTGAKLGSIVPGVGTAVGAVAGGLLGGRDCLEEVNLPVLVFLHINLLLPNSKCKMLACYSSKHNNQDWILQGQGHKPIFAIKTGLLRGLANNGNWHKTKLTNTSKGKFRLMFSKISIVK
jgi:hypothetical protein